MADEPTGNIDSASAADILDLFGELNNEGVTLVVVTHDAGVAERAERTVALKDGRIVSDERSRDAVKVTE